MGIVDWFKGRFGGEDEIPDPMRSCDRCGFTHPEISMVIEGSSIFCHDCNSKRKKDLEEAEFRRKQALANQKIKYYCYNCKFHFARKKEFQVELCPNCGKSNFVPESRIV